MITAKQKEPNNSGTQRTKGPQKVKGNLGSASLNSVLMEGRKPHQGKPPVGRVSVSLSLCCRPSQDNSLDIPSSGYNSYLWSNTAQPSVMHMPPPPAPVSPGTASTGTSRMGPPRSCPHRVTPFRDALVSTITRALRPVPGKPSGPKKWCSW